MPPIASSRISQGSARASDPSRAALKPLALTATRSLSLAAAHTLGVQAGREVSRHLAQYAAAARHPRSSKPTPTPNRREATAATAARERRLAQRTRQLDKLSTIEGIYMNRAEEVQYVADLPEAQYQFHLARMRKSYRRRGPSEDDGRGVAQYSADQKISHLPEVEKLARWRAALAAGKAIASASLATIDAVSFGPEDVQKFVQYAAANNLTSHDPRGAVRLFKAARLAGKV